MSVEELRRKILDSQSLYYTHQIINVRKFLMEQNQQFFDKLALMTLESQPNSAASSKRTTKSKSVSKFSIPRSMNATTSISSLKQRNDHLQRQLNKLREKEIQKHIIENPRMKDLHEEIVSKEKQVEIHAQINKQFKQVIEGKSDMFEMYEKMCRRCESIRKANDEISEEVKNCIKTLNELTGKDQNPNLFIMNFK